MSALASMRTWILVHVVSGLASMAFGLWFTWNEEATEESPLFAPWTGLDAGPEWMWVAVSLAMLFIGVMALVGLVGMYLYRRWARTLSLALALPSLAMMFFFPAEATPGAVAIWYDISTMAFGAALYSAYWGPSANRFDAAKP